MPIPRPHPSLFAAVLLALTALPTPAQQPASTPDLADFKTVETAATLQAAATSPNATGQAGYLGLLIEPDKRNRLVVSEVQTDSPAAKAGIQAGDVIHKADGKGFKTSEEFREWLRGKAPKDTVKLSIEHKGKKQDVEAVLGALSRPRSLEGARASLGIQVGEAGEDGAPITRVTPGSAAATAGVRSGDQLLKVDGAVVTGALRMADTVAERKPGDVMTLTLRRDGQETEVKVTLAEESNFQGRQGEPVARSLWKKEVFRLAVIPIEYQDVKHNEVIKTTDWEESLFSKGAYVNKTCATGQTVYGSVNDYYQELSNGALRVEGKVFDWVQVSKNRSDYTSGTGTGGPNRTALLTEALDALLKRDGDTALEGCDGIFFIYAGGRFPTSRGGIYWPHRSSVFHKGKRWGYFIVQEGGPRMTNISVFCHEFGHMLGLPDLYARPENPGSEGLGIWCAMSNQAGNGRPQHMSAWCKEQLGWLKPAVIDPTVKQKLILSPIEGSTKECFKILLRPDGSEYLLLENRTKKGFDQSLPAEGLLIWRIVGRKPMLEESHGVSGPPGPGVFMSAVPYPSGANDAFTPYTSPSSRSQLAGGLPVYITNIRRLPDGRVTFYVGYEFD
jgi:M6 family metalloprotease-like protein